MNAVTIFLSGAITTQCLVASLFFRRYAKKTGDTFFHYFAIAFSLFAIERVILVTIDGSSEYQPMVYFLRLSAFLVIIAAIVMKNRRGPSASLGMTKGERKTTNHSTPYPKSL